ncbi:hypothetical protein LINPERPRIM_LOCUS37226, partial [Linum perenne]
MTTSKAKAGQNKGKNVKGTDEGSTSKGRKKKMEKNSQPTTQEILESSDGGFVTRCSPQRISQLQGKFSADKIARLKSYGFGDTLKVSMTQIPFEFRRWLVDIYDVPSKSFILAPDMSLSITEEDVQDVYGLPKGAEVINLAFPAPCKKLMTALTSALGLKFSKEGKWNVDLKETKLLGKCPIVDNWCQLYMLYLLGGLLCPTSNQVASMTYHWMLGFKSLKRMKDYNWCKHVLDHLHQGMVKAKSGKYIESDLHLVIVCICQKFGRGGSDTTKKPYCANWDTKKAKKELRVIQGKRPHVMNEESPLVKPLFGPSTEIDFNGMSDVQVAEMEKWILSIRDKCDSNLARLHNLKRDNVRQGKRTVVADIQSSGDDSERTESVGLNDVPTSAEEENSSKVASKGPLAEGQSSPGLKSKDSPVDDGPTVSEIAAQTIQSLHVDDDDDFDNEPLHNLRKRKMDARTKEKVVVQPRPKRNRKPAPATKSPYTTEGKSKPIMEKQSRLPNTVRVTQVLDDDRSEEIDIEVEALKAYILSAKDKWKTSVVDFGSAEFCGTVHANVKKPCLKFGRHGKIAEEAIHSHSWMKEHGDISSCDY